MTVLAVVIAAGFVVLASLHVHWAMGGRIGAEAVIPEVRGRPAFVPGPGVTLVVAAALAACALLVLATAGLVPVPIPDAWLQPAMAALAVAFALRAVGDFRLVGLTKRVRGTRFARMDDVLYVPLCLALSLGVGTIVVLQGC